MMEQEDIKYHHVFNPIGSLILLHQKQLKYAQSMRCVMHQCVIDNVAHGHQGNKVCPSL